MLGSGGTPYPSSAGSEMPGGKLDGALAAIDVAVLGLPFSVFPVDTDLSPGGDTPVGNADGAAIVISSDLLELGLGEALELVVLCSSAAEAEVDAEAIGVVPVLVVCVEVPSDGSEDLLEPVGGSPYPTR